MYQIQGNNKLKKKWLKTNTPQSAELDYQRIVAPLLIVITLHIRFKKNIVS